MGRGGPKGAVSVCRDEAQQLTASVGKAHQLTIGRTSHQVRNPVNAPRAWAAGVVASNAGARRRPRPRSSTWATGRCPAADRHDGDVRDLPRPADKVEAAIGDVRASIQTTRPWVRGGPARLVL
jgi:hypothetical protein